MIFAVKINWKPGWAPGDVTQYHFHSRGWSKSVMSICGSSPGPGATVAVSKNQKMRKTAMASQDALMSPLTTETMNQELADSATKHR